MYEADARRDRNDQPGTASGFVPRPRSRTERKEPSVVTFLSRMFFVEKEVEIVITTRHQIRQDEDQKRLKRVPLRSEVAIPQVMPPVFRTGDLIALFLLNVFWVTNITPIAAGGPAGFLYWIVCGGAFFIHCSLVMAQLAKMFPHEGSILNWTAHALGARWSFFVGICAWLPGILSIVNAAAACISWVQALDSQWLIQPWQQGFAILVLQSHLQGSSRGQEHRLRRKQDVQDACPQTLFQPALIATGHRRPRSKALRQLAPGGTGPCDPEHTFHDEAMIGGGTARRWLLRGQERTQLLPVLVRERRDPQQPQGSRWVH